MAKRKTEKDYYDLAKFRGFKWLGKKPPKNAHTKTLWECKKRHQWHATYSNIFSCGAGCPYCAKKIKKVEKDYYNSAKIREFKWVDEKLPKSTHTKTLWECKKGHQWWATYDNIVNNGSGCPYCSGHARIVEEDYYILAKQRGFIWAGGCLPKTTMFKTSWICKNNHKWLATYHDIKSGRGCLCCLRKTEKDYYMLAKIRGFMWIGVVLPKTTTTKTLWKCSKGHEWQAQYSSIQSGNGCPYCRDMINGAPVSKPQIKLNNLLCGSLNYSEGRYRIDVAIMRNSQKIAVEYDAQYWHQGNEEHDEKRDKFLISCGWKVLHVKSGILLPIRKQLKKAINKLLNGKDLVNIYLEDWKI